MRTHSRPTQRPKPRPRPTMRPSRLPVKRMMPSATLWGDSRARRRSPSAVVRSQNRSTPKSLSFPVGYSIDRRSMIVLRHFHKSALRSASELPRVAMVQSSGPRNCDNLTHLSRFDRPFFGSVLLKSRVRSIFVVVDNVRPYHPAEMALTDRDQVVATVLS